MLAAGAGAVFLTAAGIGGGASLTAVPIVLGIQKATHPGRCRPLTALWEGHRPVPMLAELLDAVVGVDTHRDTHEVEIALPTGAPLATRSSSNDSGGYAELIDWIVQHAPGPRLVIAIEGTRSYRVGLARSRGRRTGWSSNAHNHPAVAAAAGANPIRSTRIWRC
jgi:hypothetical protein